MIFWKKIDFPVSTVPKFTYFFMKSNFYTLEIILKNHVWQMFPFDELPNRVTNEKEIHIDNNNNITVNF